MSQPAPQPIRHAGAGLLVGCTVEGVRCISEAVGYGWGIPLGDRVEAIEVYSAATMLVRGGSLRGYKKPEAESARTALLDIARREGWIWFREPGLDGEIRQGLAPGSDARTPTLSSVLPSGPSLRFTSDLAHDSGSPFSKVQRLHHEAR